MARVAINGDSKLSLALLTRVCLVAKLKVILNLKELKKSMFSKRARMWLGLIAALSLLSLASSCGGGSKTDDTGKDDGKGKAYASKGDEGSITGKVSYTGAVPEAKKIDTSADAA